jgi:hypothetical protein
MLPSEPMDDPTPRPLAHPGQPSLMADGRALAREPLRRRGADPAGRAGDQRDPVPQPHPRLRIITFSS